MKYYMIALIVVAAMSLIGFVLYAVDKRKAEKNKWRIPERVLLLISALGGAIGTYPAMYIFHHKTRKWYFHAVNVLGLVVAVTFTCLMLCLDGII